MLWNLKVGVIVEFQSEYDDWKIYVLDDQQYSWYVSDDFVAVKEEYKNFSLCLTERMKSKIYQLHVGLDNLDLGKYTLYTAELQLLDNLISNNLTREAQNVIFADGLEKVLSREKGTGIRIIKLRNGQIWKAHRVKRKSKPLRKKIAQQYAENSLHKNHTIHYELICQL